LTVKYLLAAQVTPYTIAADVLEKKSSWLNGRFMVMCKHTNKSKCRYESESVPERLLAELAKPTGFATEVAECGKSEFHKTFDFMFS
jgi:hypothetical protein